MANYTTPDVYVEEISTIPPSVAQVATAIPAFIGYTQMAQAGATSLKNVPFKIFSMKDYEQYYGGPFADALAMTVSDDGSGGFYLKLPFTPPNPRYLMYYAVNMFFDNGGSQCYIVSVNPYAATPAAIPANFPLADFHGTPAPPAPPVGLDAVALADEPTMIVIPESVYMTRADYETCVQAVLMQCFTLGSRFGIFDIYDGLVDLNSIDSVTAPAPAAGTTLMQTDRGYFGTNNLSYGAAYYPFLQTVYNPFIDAAQDNLMVTYNQIIPAKAAVPAVAAVAAVPAVPATATTPAIPAVPAVAAVAAIPAVPASTPTTNATFGSFETSNTALYNFVESQLQAYFVNMPPSGSVAGVYAATDNARGVWKAPANVSLTDVVQPIVAIDNAHQGFLNVDAFAGKSINAIRAFTGKGTLVWGARTLLGNDNEWRYVPVRRFFIMVEQSVKNSIYWAVFEPNDANTWTKVRGMIENYLTQLWREGALAGATTTDAFYVQCGLGTTMTADDILNGYMNVEIGMAPVRPAEFIVLKFSQKIQVS